MKERSDRVLVSPEWRSLFPKMKVFDEAVIGSDHAPLVIYSAWSDKRGRKPFRFESVWTTYDKFRDVIRESWERRSDDRIEAAEARLALCNLKLPK